MSLGTLGSWLLCGLIVGLLARWLVPGRQRLGLPQTAGLGILGACTGGFLYWTVKGEAGDAFSFASHAWHGWVVSVLGAAFVLWAYGALFPRRWWQ